MNKTVTTSGVLPQFSVFETRLSTNPKPCTMDEVVQLCGDGNADLVARTARIREAVASGNAELKGKLKAWLPCITLSGVFEGGHRKECLREYNGNVMVDFDSLCTDGAGQAELMADLVKALSNDSRIYGCTVSPSGNGLHIFFRTDNRDISKHALAWRHCSDIATDAVQNHLRYAATGVSPETTSVRMGAVSADTAPASTAQFSPENEEKRCKNGCVNGHGKTAFLTENEAKQSRFCAENEVKSDEACKNINRLTYLCHDPYFYYNPDSQAVNMGDSAVSCSQNVKKVKNVKDDSGKTTFFMQKQSTSTDNNDITSSSLKQKNMISEVNGLHSLLSLLLEEVRPLYEDAKRAIPEMERGN